MEKQKLTAEQLQLTENMKNAQGFISAFFSRIIGEEENKSLNLVKDKELFTGAIQSKLDTFESFGKEIVDKVNEEKYALLLFEGLGIQIPNYSSESISDIVSEMDVQWICHDTETACEFCQERHEQTFKLENLPITHPNCRCGIRETPNPQCSQDGLVQLLEEKFDEWANGIAGFFRNYKEAREALDIILKYDDTITYWAHKLKIDKALIQAVLFQEIMARYFADDIADAGVIFRWMNPQLPFLGIGDSSTGLGQVFARTAIDVLNKMGITKEDGNPYDANNPDDIWEIWNKLRDDEFNIEIIARNLWTIINNIQGTPKGLKEDLDAITDFEERLKAILGRYNGFDTEDNDNAASRYGNVAYEYYRLFKIYSQCGKTDAIYHDGTYYG